MTSVQLNLIFQRVDISCAEIYFRYPPRLTQKLRGGNLVMACNVSLDLASLFIPLRFFLPRRVTRQNTISTIKGPICAQEYIINFVHEESISKMPFTTLQTKQNQDSFVWVLMCLVFVCQRCHSQLQTKQNQDSFVWVLMCLFLCVSLVIISQFQFSVF